MIKDARLHVEILPSGRHARLLETFRADLPGWRPVVVPGGFETDFASVPRILWAVIPPWGKYSAAAVAHDWLYHKGKFSRWTCDAFFREHMAQLGVRRGTRWLMWAGVRLGGWVAWRSHRRREAVVVKLKSGENHE